MPTTFSNLVPVRRVAVGDCSGPLGSGFDALARSAYSALLRADWTQSADPPFLPVHDNGQTANKTIPRGDAWKCSYGYDATARTERSACGAVCYTFALPSDAHSGTPANISTVSLSLTGDRYLDAGVDLYLVPSASPTPPSISDLLALTPVGTYCATSDQSPTKPNERHGVSEAVAATLGVAAQPFLHVALLLHDYTTNRGAWIEGGAMLEGATATITFSREVAVDTPQGVRILRVTSAKPSDVTAKTVSLASFGMRYFVRGFPATPTNEDTDACITEALRLAAAGRIESNQSGNKFVYDASIKDAGTYLTWGDSGHTWWFYSFLSFYYAPGAKIAGMQIDYPFLRTTTDGGDGVVRIALVQMDAAPDTDDPADFPCADVVRDAWNGSGDNLLGFSDVKFTGGAPSSDETITATIDITRNPDKPYLAICMVAMTQGVSATLGWNSQRFDDGILVASNTP